MSRKTLKISEKLLRKIIRESLEEMIVEVAVLTPPMVVAKNALTKANRTLGTKASVLFSRLVTNRISDIEAEQLSDEIKNLIPKSVRPEESQKAAELFDNAVESYRETKAGTEKIGDMISTTLQAAKPVKNITFTSVARDPFPSSTRSPPPTR